MNVSITINVLNCDSSIVKIIPMLARYFYVLILQFIEKKKVIVIWSLIKR